MPDYIILGIAISALIGTAGLIGVIAESGWRGVVSAVAVVVLSFGLIFWSRMATGEQTDLATISYHPIISIEGMKGFKFNDKFHQFENDGRFADIATTQVKVEYAKEGWYLGVRVTGDHFKYSLVPKTDR